MDHDAIVIGSGPNGLAAAITLARAGWSVLIREAAATLGGGCRTAELTIPGFAHDVCSAVHPFGVSSPFLRTLPLAEHGLQWVQPAAAVAHPLDNGPAVTLETSISATAAGLGADASAYLELIEPLVRDWPTLEAALLQPLLTVPRHPLALARFGMLAIRSARNLAEERFRGERAQALFAGSAAHAILPLEATASASFGLVLSVLGHVAGWPVPRGGSQQIANALTSYFRSLGGEIVAGAPVESLDELPRARAVLCDVTPRQLLRLAGRRLPRGYGRALERFRYGPGAFKLDWALSGPIPWTASECARAATVHVGGTLDEIAASERRPWEGGCSDRPFVLLVQPSLFDPTRAPAGMHTAWAYCHVPNGSAVDMTERIERQVERFAPGFRDLILARSGMSTLDLERRNPNLVGGDITGGAQDLRQLIARPVPRLVPYATPVPGLYLCSASTPPGGGVHGMCGYHAARALLRQAKGWSGGGRG